MALCCAAASGVPLVRLAPPSGGGPIGRPPIVPRRPATLVGGRADGGRWLAAGWDGGRPLGSEVGGAIERASGLPPAKLKDDKRSGMRVHARTGETCPVCGDVVREVSFADSSLQYCATCQTGGKPLADRRLSKLLK